ncbi:MAG: bifunctional oligoribonuclease/PAP phosphatase NrnA [Clostridia bacterium]|nr:bifunctional oligoribonuclease/PAP phosphatase NrnA [Clostridia bacterium]
MLAQKKAILQKIKDYDKIFLFRHFRPDGDAVGSTKGMAEIIKINFPEKKVYLQNADFSDYVAFLGEEDALLPDEEYSEALAIVIDTGTAKRVSNQKFTLCKEIIKIDHHIPTDSYGDLEWVEENRSSACEMIADFYDTFKDELKINKTAATCIYAGMVTDSGRFRYREVDGETMRLAGLMLDQGVDTDVLYANLYLKDFSLLKFEAYVQNKIKVTKNGVAYIFVSKAMKKKFNLSNEDASAAVSYLDAIRGSLIWIAFIENDDAIRVRFRSRFVTVSELAEKYRGGGHACAAGGTVYSKREMKKAIAEADELLKNYKENNKGWL